MIAHTPHPQTRGQSPQTPRHDIAALKERLLIPEVWQKLGLQGQPAAMCHSPFRPDKSPSFSIYKEGRRWKDFGNQQGGDVIDFIATARQTSTAQALRLFLELAGVPTALPSRVPQARTARSSTCETMTALQAPQAAARSGGVRVPYQSGTEENRQQVAEARQISLEAVSLGLALRTLTFGLVQGFPCWILTDAEQCLAEARRLGGHPFPATDTLGVRKAHTLRGSCKSWPLGVAVLRRIPDFRTVLLVEGGPDYLAALHFAAELDRWDVLPVAMLGRSAGAKIDPAALELLQGRCVRIYPHADADGGGTRSARQWAMQLHSAGCTVDLFDFSVLHRTDGSPINDLNDCTTGLDEASLALLREHLIPPPHEIPAFAMSFVTI
jgi:hypothetical protein